MMQAGDAYNVIPPEVKLGGTIRSLTLDGLIALQNRIRDIATNVAQAHRCQAEVSFPGNDYPPTVNDDHCWKLVRDIGGELLGAERVFDSPPVMGGEDFAYYTEQVPGCFVGLGVRNAAIGADYSVHHPKFKVDEAALPLGTSLHVAFAIRSLGQLPT